MPLEIRIEHILIFCIVQTVLIIIVLFQKRFRQMPNFFLGIIFSLLTSLYVLHLLEYLHIFDDLTMLKGLKRAAEQIPAPIIYTYMLLLLSGETIFKKRFIKFFIVPVAAFFSLFILMTVELIPLFSEATTNQLYYIFMYVGSAVAGIQFYVFGYNLVLLIQSKSRKTESVLKCLISIKEKRYRWARFMAIVFFVHGTIFIFECLFIIIHPDSNGPLLLHTIFYITLGYVLIINLIQNPAIIHFSSKTAGSLVLKKYEKSGLSEEEAKSLMAKMNDYMHSSKPFLKSDLSINDLSDDMGIPVHTISEVTNGLMGQNFFDYINNYRIEEFKVLANDPSNKSVKILYLAFEAGFSSKTSFNFAFKKFTKETPSQFMKRIAQ